MGLTFLDLFRDSSSLKAFQYAFCGKESLQMVWLLMCAGHV